MAVAVLCVALLGVLELGLGLSVSLARARTGIGDGYPADPTNSLHKLVRCHGNTAEYAALLGLLFILVGSRNPSGWALWSIIGATASRYVLALGLIISPTLARPHPLRFVGALGTYLFGLALCVAILLRV